MVKDASGKAIHITANMANKIIEMNINLANMVLDKVGVVADKVGDVTGLNKVTSVKEPHIE